MVPPIGWGTKSPSPLVGEGVFLKPSTLSIPLPSSVRLPLSLERVAPPPIA